MKRSLPFGYKREPRLMFSVLSLILAIALVIFLIANTIFALNPFQTGNPLMSEVTVGERVIGDWQYNGENQQGQLVFYNGYQSVIMPGNSKTFAADGEYVNIISHTHDTLTYETALNSELINIKSIAAVLLLFLLLIMMPFVINRYNRRTRQRSASTKRRKNNSSHFHAIRHRRSR